MEPSIDVIQTAPVPQTQTKMPQCCFSLLLGLVCRGLFHLFVYSYFVCSSLHLTKPLLVPVNGLIMKRALMDAEMVPPPAFKRRPSISTVLDKDEDNASPLVCNKHVVEDESEPTISATEVSSDQDGLYLEEDDDENDVLLSQTADAKGSVHKPLAPVSGFLPFAVEVPIKINMTKPARLGQTTQLTRKGWLRTGIVHEASSGHFDRSDSYHKERPSRVLSVMEALKNDADALLGKCHLLGACLDSRASDFLGDDDYLQVHLPGYMQR